MFGRLIAAKHKPRLLKQHDCWMCFGLIPYRRPIFSMADEIVVKHGKTPREAWNKWMLDSIQKSA